MKGTVSSIARVARTRRVDQNGFVAIFTVICFSGFMFGCAALGVDVARWYLEGQRLQRAADAGALGGVSYLPQDLDSARATARAIAARNGYTDGSNGSSVSAKVGSKTSQLVVTACSTTNNSFGMVLGMNQITICRTAVADFTGPAPMGSPCNTFGNEPSGGGGASTPAPNSGSAKSGTYTNCVSNPQMWSEIEGPNIRKFQGDRFQTLVCGQGVGVTTDGKIDGCDTSDVNTDYDPAGYFYLVHVDQKVIDNGSSIDLQLFDPAYVTTGQSCGSLPDGSSSALQAKAYPGNAPNTYVSDAQSRYTSAANTTSGSWNGTTTCPGDAYVGPTTTPTVTSFALRQQTDSLNPLIAPVQTNTSGVSCIRQYAGIGTAPTWNQLSSTVVAPNGSGSKTTTTPNTSYNDELAKEFHNWTSFCSFKPTRAGDYYLQVRTNVSLGGTPIGSNGLAYTGNTAVLDSSTGDETDGDGANGFAIRAVTDSASRDYVAVSSYDKMPIYVNASGAQAQFNLIRVLPGAAGKSISFSYFDVGDAARNSTGSIQVKLPSDAKTTANAAYTTDAQRFPNGCRAVGGYAGASGTTYTNCSAPFTGPIATANGSNNGKLETISIPIPSDYTCNYASLGGCWYQVVVTFLNATSVTDVTTWTADIVGQPVRLIQ